MNSYLPETTHVAVREGKILGVGNLDQLSGWGEHTLDTRFADKVLMPGFVEGHCHAPEGQIWDYTYLGYFERHDPQAPDVRFGGKGYLRVVRGVKQYLWGNVPRGTARVISKLIDPWL